MTARAFERAVLGLDCSGATCSAALVVGGQLVAEREEDCPGEQLRHFFPMVDALLRENRTRFEALGRIAVTVGPGSFTGLRLGLTTARTIAQLVGCPVVPVGTLEACARGMVEWLEREGHEAPFRLAAILDARKKQVFTATWEVSEDGMLVPLTSAQALSPPQAGGLLEDFRPAPGAGLGAVGGSGLRAYPQIGTEGLLVAPEGAARPHARHVALVGAGVHGDVQELPYGAVAPYYLRPPDVAPPRIQRQP